MPSRPSRSQLGAIAVAGAAIGGAAWAAGPEPIGLAQVLQVVGGLIAVLLAIAIVAFAGRRLKLLRGGTGQRMRILDGISVGARDRIVLLEVEHKRILLGLSPGRIHPLHVFGEPETAFRQVLHEAAQDIGEDEAA